MLRAQDNETLVKAFQPGVGEDPLHDNMGGAILKELSETLLNFTMAKHLDDMTYITQKDIYHICNAVEWFRSVFREFEA